MCIILYDHQRKLDRTGALEGEGIVLRLISNSFRISTATIVATTAPAEAQKSVSAGVTVDSAAVAAAVCAVRMQDAIKVAFRTGEVLDVITGSEPRVPLQYHEFVQVLLEYTS